MDNTPEAFSPRPSLDWRHVVIALVVVGSLATILIVWPPFGQYQEYHNFVDKRPLAGIPNFGDVASNLAFLLVGIPLMWIEWGVGRHGGQRGHGSIPGMFESIWKHPVAKYLGVPREADDAARVQAYEPFASEADTDKRPPSAHAFAQWSAQ